VLRYIKNRKIKKWYTTKTGKRRTYIDRRPKAWQKWREKVYNRDNRTCVLCGRKSRRMAPHHILPKKDFPVLKYRVSNGATLCWRCHKVHTFYKEYSCVERIVKKIFGKMENWRYNNIYQEYMKNENKQRKRKSNN